MAFTTPEFPGRTFDTFEEMVAAKEEKIRLQNKLQKDTIFTIIENVEDHPDSTSE